MRASERRFRTLIDSAADIVWLAAPGGELDPPQPAWLAFTGQTADEYRGWGWVDAVHADDRAASAEAWAAAVEQRSMFLTEYRLRRRDGAYRIMLARAVPIFDDLGELCEWVGVCSDITHRKAAEQAVEQARVAAEQANRAKSQFIANMSHELRTPLSAVIGYSEMLSEELRDIGHADLEKDVGKIESSARHLLSLINDVLDLSKIEAGRMTVSAVEFDVRAMVDDVVASIGPLIGNKGNVLQLDAPDRLGTMRSDEVKIRQCLLNLLGNAAKFTEQGQVVLRVRRGPVDGTDSLRFDVQDTGIGLTDEQMGRLFQRFTQADESTTRQFGGTGLGLAITRAFCRKLGGDATVTSVMGEGSTFTIVLPAEMAAESADGSDMAQVGGDGATEGVVLVVDDDPAARELMTRFLQREGFQVRSAADGKSGLSLARALRPRAILLDVEMPRMDGWSVLHAIRGDADLAAVPVIMVSVVDDQSLGYSLGATDYLTKPVEWDRLKGVMDRFHTGMMPGRVLVIDDDVDARARIRVMLERGGWSVLEAGNGQEALERLAGAAPDLILLDLMMPVMDGFAFLSKLRHRQDGQDTPVVVLTAKDITAHERAQLEHQADRVILKGTMRLTQLAQELRHVTRGAGPSAARDGG